MADRMVVDASVAAKWFLKDELESALDLADDLLAALLAGDIELHAPNTLRYEMCGLLTKAYRQSVPSTGGRRLGKADALAHVRDFFALPLRFHDPDSEKEAEAVELGIDHGKSYYDMTYVRLARDLNCQCCVADEGAIKSVRSGFPHAHVLTLSQLRTT
jgi:predicted nucleic acid-binding protein